MRDMRGLSWNANELVGKVWSGFAVSISSAQKKPGN